MSKRTTPKRGLLKKNEQRLAMRQRQGSRHDEFEPHVGAGLQNVTIADRSPWLDLDSEPPQSVLWLLAFEAGDQARSDARGLIDLLRSKVAASPRMQRLLADFVERRELKSGSDEGIPWAAAKVPTGDLQRVISKLDASRAISRPIRALLAALLENKRLGRPHSRKSIPAYERTPLELALMEARELIDGKGVSIEQAARAVAPRYGIPHIMADDPEGDGEHDYAPLKLALENAHEGLREIRTRRRD